MSRQRQVLDHPQLSPPQIVLASAEPHGLYERFGFACSRAPRMSQQPRKPDVAWLTPVLLVVSVSAASGV